ncbi:hypothetical protein OSTOST_03647, partial [Ostertagia ostertagi]
MMQQWLYDQASDAGNRGMKSDLDRGQYPERQGERYTYDDYYQRFEETSDSRFYQNDPRRGEPPNQRDRRRPDSPNRYRNRSRSRSRDRRYSR